MIFTERTIRVTNGASQINSPIVLYKGDKNIKIRFKIVDCPYTYSKNVDNIIEVSEASYAQLIIKTPNDGLPIFSDIAATESGYVTFTITGEMIDEAKEVGKYSFQVRLLDSEQFSRITIPEVVDGIDVRDPIAIEGVSATNEVDVAVVNYAVTTAAATEDAFNSEGNYNKTTWGAGDRITAAKLNKIEAGIDGVNKKVASGGTGSGEVDLSSYAKKTDLPTKTSQLTNDSGYITSIPDEYITETELNAKGYATTSQIPTVPTNVSEFTNDAHYASETYVTNKIAEAQLGGGSGTVDLSGYVTKETGNANQITFADGQTFQAKLDAGTLKGEKGDAGEQGPQGPQGEMGPAGATTASGVSITDTANNFTATDVEGALAEASSQIKDIENELGTETLNTTAQDLKGAINEVFQSASNGKTLIANAITGMGIEASSTDTFEQLANKILLIIPTTYGNIIVDVTSLEITEGGTGTFKVCLYQAPTNNQTINIASDNSKVTVNPSKLTFTPSNYNTTQTVTVSAEDDDIEDNGYTLKLTLSSSNVDSVIIDITVKDNDLIIEWHTVTTDELNLKTVAGKKYSYSISSNEPNLILPAKTNVDGVDTQVMYAIKLGTDDSPNTTLKRLKIEDGYTFNVNSLSNICYNCQSLVSFEANLEGITNMSSSFYNNTSLKDLSNITLPETLTNITQMCNNCSNLEKAPVISESITKAHFAFQNCKKLKKATVKNKNIYLNGTANTTGMEPFNNCEGITIKCYNDSQFYSDMRNRCANAETLNKYYYEPLGNDIVTNIHCFGDSLTQGVNGSSGYPNALLELLGTDFWVYNMSKAGYTTEQIAGMMEPQLCHVKDNVIIWSGSNDGEGLTESERVAKVQTLVDKVPTGVNYLVIGLITYRYTDAVNEAFRNAFGEHFLDMHSALCSTDAFTSIGETPTDDDITAINSGTLPPSLISTQHMTVMGDKAVAKIICDKLASNNYITI